MVKSAKLAATTSRFTWMEATSLKLLAFFKMIKEKHGELSKKPGFINFNKYILENDKRKEKFPLQAKLKNYSLLRQ